MVTTHENMSTTQFSSTIEALSMLLKPLFKTGFFRFMRNASFINKVSRLIIESMIFVFYWMELILGQI